MALTQDLNQGLPAQSPDQIYYRCTQWKGLLIFSHNHIDQQIKLIIQVRSSTFIDHIKDQQSILVDHIDQQIKLIMQVCSSTFVDHIKVTINLS